MSDYSNAKREYDILVSQEQREDRQILRISNLSAIIRKMHRYAQNNNSIIACEKIKSLFIKAEHLLDKTSPLKKVVK